MDANQNIHIMTRIGMRFFPRLDLSITLQGKLAWRAATKSSLTLFSLKPTRNNRDSIKFVCGLQLQSLNIYEAWFSIFFSSLFFRPRPTRNFTVAAWVFVGARPAQHPDRRVICYKNGAML